MDTTKTPTVAELIEDAQNWRSDSSGITAVCQTRRSAAERLYRIDEQDLRLHHEMLPEIIQALVSHNELVNEDASKKAQASAILVRESVHLLKKGRVAVRDITDELRIPVLTDHIRTHGGNVVIKGLFASMYSTTVNGKPVEVVIGGIQGFIEIPFKKMEAQYPGWATRLNVGESVSMDSDELMRYVLSNNPASEVTVSLPQLGM